MEISSVSQHYSLVTTTADCSRRLEQQQQQTAQYLLMSPDVFCSAGGAALNCSLFQALHCLPHTALWDAEEAPVPAIQIFLHAVGCFRLLSYNLPESSPNAGATIMLSSPTFICLFLQVVLNKEVIIFRATMAPDIHAQDVLCMMYWSICSD